MPRTGDHASESGEYTADWHCTVFMRAGMAFPACPDCGEIVEFTKVPQPEAISATPVESLCPNCRRGVLPYPTFPIPDGATTFCQPHDPWNAGQECLLRFRYDAAGDKGWQPWPVPKREAASRRQGATVRAWWRRPTQKVAR